MERQSVLPPHQFKRVQQFLNFDCPPPTQHAIDTILVLGTSKASRPESYKKRIDAAVHYANMYPQSTVMFSGKRPDISRAVEHEMDSDFSEAAGMAQDATQVGLAKERVLLESNSTNTRENILFAATQLQNSNNILILCSSYLGRRVSLYLTRMQREGLIPRGNYFIIDVDVRRDREGYARSPDEEEKKEYSIMYEWERLVRYRRKGHL